MHGPGDATTAAPAGSIVLVGTPIGNLGDLSARAVETLRDASVVLCEDTRRTRVLLSASGIAAPRLESLHAHSEATGAARAIALAQGGATVVVVTDAGMPGISDPGWRVVRAAADAGVAVTTVPGPTAAVSALVLSGIEAERWCFEGFLPRRGSDRTRRVAALGVEARTSVLYEAPHRVARTLADLTAVCGSDRRVALGRELTKRYEEVWRGTLGEAAVRLAAGETRGEWVIVLAGAPDEEASDSHIRERLSTLMGGGADRRDAVAEVTAETGARRRRVYDIALALRGADDHSREGARPDGGRVAGNGGGPRSAPR